MKKRVYIRYIKLSLKILVALAAAGNLIALFVFHYETPSWLRKGARDAAAQEIVNVDSDLVPSVSPINMGVHFMIPVIPLNYSGEAALDEMALDGVYLLDKDDQPIEDVEIRYEILEGESKLKKTVRYTVELENGDILTEDRAMNLTARYTGPAITLLGILPEIDPAEADSYTAILLEEGVIRADDGFGNDVTDQVYAMFDGLSDEDPEADMTLVLENQVHDEYEMWLKVQVQDYTGVVLTLSEYHFTMTEGDEFDPYSFVKVAHDTEGNDLTEDVTADNGVDTDEPGDYEVWYWVQDSEGTYSPTKKLYVTVEAAPEEESETEEDAP